MQAGRLAGSNNNNTITNKRQSLDAVNRMSKDMLLHRPSLDTERTQSGTFDDTEDGKDLPFQEDHHPTPPGEKPAEHHGGDTALANAPWRYKVIALATALMLPVGSHFSTSALSAMKSSIRDMSDLIMRNVLYGITLNDIFFFKISILTIHDTVSYHPLFPSSTQYSLLLENLYYPNGFAHKIYPLLLACNFPSVDYRLFLGTLVANPITERTGNWAWAFWLAFVLCGFYIVMNVIYALVVYHLEGTSEVTDQEVSRLKKKKSFKYKSIMKFPVFFWNVIVIEFNFASVWSSFQTISTDLVQNRFGTTGVLAGYTASASQIMPIVVVPLLGIFIDMFGYRIKILTFSGVFLIICAVLLGYTYVNAVVGMVFYSFSLAFGTIPMITSIGMILPSDYIGTGLGIYKSSNNIGSVILDIIVGLVQDRTQGQSYSGVMILYLVMACMGLCIVVAFLFIQRFFMGNLLELSRKKRQELMKERNDREIELNRQGYDSFEEMEVKTINVVIIGLFTAALLASWVLFFVFSIGTHTIKI
ncbi:major facilitator superfamily domain-containing protein [Phascolomyces articulosus]|uniref:Lysosomal dipeptide transporter MFSD1 n=1 Tax=Phascolomyces articulosus TaxID=60185 RepID=A0AAD5K3J6_9FUNG|nr:major facilitator superfamily domain-containing protein [Phascolomyces articulosus]